MSVKEGIGPVTVKTEWTVPRIKSWLWLLSSFMVKNRNPVIDEGVFPGREQALSYFDIWLDPNRSERGAIVYQDSKGRWWVDDYATPFGEQIYKSFFQDGIAEVKRVEQFLVKPKPIIEKVEVVQKPEPVIEIEKEVIPTKPKKRGKAQYEQRPIKESIRGSIFPPAIVPESFLKFRPILHEYELDGHHVDYGAVDYVDDYELSEIRELLEHGRYSRVA